MMVDMGCGMIVLFVLLVLLGEMRFQVSVFRFQDSDTVTRPTVYNLMHGKRRVDHRIDPKPANLNTLLNTET